MIRAALYLACFLAVAIHSGTALPIPIRISTSDMLPGTGTQAGPQRMFALPVAPAHLRIVDDEDDCDSPITCDSTPAATGHPTRFASLSAAFAEPTALAGPASPTSASSAYASAATLADVNNDSIFSEAVLPGGIEASLAAVLASHAAEELELARQLEAHGWTAVGKNELKKLRKAAFEAQRLRENAGAAPTDERNSTDGTVSPALPPSPAA